MRVSIGSLAESGKEKLPSEADIPVTVFPLKKARIFAETFAVPVIESEISVTLFGVNVSLPMLITFAVRILKVEAFIG